MQISEDTFVPVFVDNAEAATYLREMKCQVICLYVSEQDKKLRVEKKPGTVTEQPKDREVKTTEYSEISLFD
jgi:hypothetical protein